MTQTAQSIDTSPAVPHADAARRNLPRATSGWRSFVRPALAGASAIVVWWLIWTVFAGKPARTQIAERVVVPVSILALICLVGSRHQVHWARPLSRLREMLPGIRAGEIPIEELAGVGGGVKVLVPELRELLIDLKRQKLVMAQLNEDLRQRVARRTDALERVIGTLRHQATRDVLTGLFNRRMLESYVPELIESCNTTKSELAVLMIDVDNFKMLNDSLGHAAGDELLRDIGSLIRSSIRHEDAGFRVGGDEFVILMPQATPEAASALAKRLISLLDVHARMLRVASKPRLSIGVALLSEAGEANPQSLLQLADQRLYDVKRAARLGRAVNSSANAA
ncbi:MAG: GGDEF domain-containing protein [Tepidisphaeraceae bacterium]